MNGEAWVINVPAKISQGLVPAHPLLCFRCTDSPCGPAKTLSLRGYANCCRNSSNPQTRRSGFLFVRLSCLYCLSLYHTADKHPLSENCHLRHLQSYTYS